MKRGDRVVNYQGRFYFPGVVCGPEDFSGYDYNSPGEGWVLVKFDIGKFGWCPTSSLEYEVGAS